jgi:hypothetical protein
MTIDASLMPFSGFLGREPLGETCRQITGNGALCIRDFAAGGIMALGKNYWKL